VADPKKLSIAILALKKRGMMMGSGPDSEGPQEDAMAGDREEDKSEDKGPSSEDSMDSALDSVSEDLASAVKSGSQPAMKAAFLQLAKILSNGDHDSGE